VLVAEYSALSLELISFAAYGDARALAPARIQPLKRKPRPSNLTTFSTGALAKLGPVVAPFERLYGIMVGGRRGKCLDARRGSTQVASFFDAVRCAEDDYGAKFDAITPGELRAKLEVKLRAKRAPAR